MDKVEKAVSWHDGKNIGRIGFNEWVYFYFSSPVLHGIIIYGWAWRHPGVMSVQLFPVNTGGAIGPAVLVDDYHIGKNEVERSATTYSTRLDSCTLMDTPERFRIEGRLNGNGSSLRWDLTFTRTLPPVESFDIPFGSLPFEQIGWKILSARSTVEGTVTVNNRSFRVGRGLGYVDTNFGRWLVACDPATDWNWLTVLDPHTTHAVVGMNIRSTPRKGALHYITPTAAVRFPVNHQTFHHRAFSEDSRTGLMKPVRTTVRASNDEGYRLNLTAENYHDTVFDQEFPLSEAGIPLPFSLRWPLIENFVKVNGEIITPDNHSVAVDAIGMKEYGVTSFIPYCLRKRLNRLLPVSGRHSC